MEQRATMTADLDGEDGRDRRREGCGAARTCFLSPTRSSPARVALARAENLESAALWQGEEAVDET